MRHGATEHDGNCRGKSGDFVPASAPPRAAGRSVMRYRLSPGSTYLGHGRWIRGHTPVGKMAARSNMPLYDQMWMRRIGAFRNLFGTKPIIGGAGGPNEQSCWHVFRRSRYHRSEIDMSKERPMRRGQFLGWWR